MWSGTLKSGNIVTSETWKKSDNIVMTGQIFVKGGATLTIEAGATIHAYADDGTGNAPALVIERGAKIIAEGTQQNPITFTTVVDEKYLPRRGLWGGIIVNGKATIGGSAIENNVEGLANTKYGGNNDNDNSGILKYVRVWYGGADIAGAGGAENSGNEINGITLAGVGRYVRAQLEPITLHL